MRQHNRAKIHDFTRKNIKNILIYKLLHFFNLHIRFISIPSNNEKEEKYLRGRKKEKELNQKREKMKKR